MSWRARQDDAAQQGAARRRCPGSGKEGESRLSYREEREIVACR